MQLALSSIAGFLFPPRVMENMNSLSKIRFKASVIALILTTTVIGILGITEFVGDHYPMALVDWYTALMACFVLIFLRRTGNQNISNLMFFGTYLGNMVATMVITGSTALTSLWWGIFPLIIALVFDSRRMVVSLVVTFWAVSAVTMHFYVPSPGSPYLPQVYLVLAVGIYSLVTLAYTAMKNRLVLDLDPDHENCKHYPFEENCVHFGDFARYMVENGHGRELSREECRDVLKKCADVGMVHGVSNWAEPVDTI